MTIDPKQIRILLAEDAATMRKIELKTLKSQGFEDIVEAVNGADAIAKLQSEDRIDLIISDWNMPEKSGLELLQWVRSNDKYRTTPFIMATGQGDKKQVKKAEDAGVSSFIAKPFNGEELNKKIEEAFGVNQPDEAEQAAQALPRTTDAGKIRLRVAHIQITDHLVLGVLRHLIQKGDLTPKHFELETYCMPSWNPVQEALEKGTVDAAFILAPIAMDLFSVDVPIKLVMLAHKSGSIFVRSTQGEFKEPFEQFYRDRTFYIPHKMSIHHMLAHMFFSNIGLKAGMVGEGRNNVNFEVAAPIKMQEFLATNANSCGFMVAEPLGTRAIAAGAAKLQFLSSELWEKHPCCVISMRDDFIGPYEEAVYEFTQMLVAAGKFIEKKPEKSAEIGVGFLDPNKNLGLKVPILKNVLSEAKGIKTGDLFPVRAELDRIQRYMYDEMGIGSIIDLDKFVDTRFAEAACKDRVINAQTTVMHQANEVSTHLLKRGMEEKEDDNSKTMLNMEGKYLSFTLEQQEFGIDILKIKEIIAMMPIRPLPEAPEHLKGVINLRGQVIPVMDIREKFGMTVGAYNDRSCIIVLDLGNNGTKVNIGITADSVSQVADIKAADIEATPNFGTGISTHHILAMAKTENGVKLLLDIDHIVDTDTCEGMAA